MGRRTKRSDGESSNGKVVVRKRMLLRLVLIGFAVILAAFGAYSVWLPFFGTYLVSEHPLAPADVILLLNGRPLERPMEAARLYHDGLAPRILLTQLYLRSGESEARALGVRVPNQAEQAVSVMRQLGVPEKVITMLPERAYSTQSEAEILLNYLRTQHLRRAIIVTSISHTRRAWNIFRLLAPADIELRMRASRFDDFQPRTWWRRRGARKIVLNEWLKLMNYWCLAWGIDWR